MRVIPSASPLATDGDAGPVLSEMRISTEMCAVGDKPVDHSPILGVFPCDSFWVEAGIGLLQKAYNYTAQGCRPPPTAHQRRHLQHLPRNPYPNAGSCGEDSHACSNSNCVSLSKRPQAPAGYWRSGSDLHGTGSCFWCGPIRPANSGLVPCKLKCNPYYAVTHRPYRRDNWVSVPPYFSSAWEVSLDAG